MGLVTLRALVFDVDGTLAETEELHRDAFNAAFAEAGLGWRWGQGDYRRLLAVTGGKERMRAFEAEGRIVPMSDGALQALHARKTALYAEGVAAGRVTLRPGVATLMDAARARGLSLAVATTTTRANVETLCRAVWRRAADRVFDVVAAGDEVAAKKPAPDVYLMALARLGVAAAEAVAFEDSRPGVASARAAGLGVVAAPSTYTTAEELTLADLVVPDLADPAVACLLPPARAVPAVPTRG